MGVYGNFLSAFPELTRKIQVWTKQDKSDIRTIAGVYLPTKGDKLKRWQYSKAQGLGRAGGSAIDYSDDDILYVDSRWCDRIAVGDYLGDPDGKDIHRVMGERDFAHAGGFKVFATERLTGATVEDTEELKIKDADF